MGSLQTRRAALVSIHPEFADRILSGEKKVEFRRRALGLGVTYIIIYATRPVGAVVGVAEIGIVECGSPATLWAQFGHVGGIGRSDFFRYFEGATTGFAYALQRVSACSPSIALGSAGLPNRPPQAFQYVEERTLNLVLRRSTMGISTGEQYLMAV